jgi:putative NIF3 family GTP cyclohydrolase 1 type 2
VSKLIEKDLKSGRLWARRQFVTTLMTATGIFPVLFHPALATVPEEKKTNYRGKMTVQQVIDLILKSIPGAPFKQTVDTVKAGSPDQEVTGIVTTMFATNEVIEKAASSGANFIIAHEPTFYSHTDETSWLQQDPVYRYKAELLKKHNMVVWRFHDYIHAHRPDGVLMGVLTALDWQKYYNDNNPRLITLPTTTLKNITEHVKSRLGIPHLKMIGNMEQVISRIALIPGAAGGKMQIETLAKEKPDLLICGELNEWETSEYVRDMRYMGSKTCLLVLGHIVSEEPGLEWLVHWLQPQIPEIKITHIPSTDAFTWA